MFRLISRTTASRSFFFFSMIFSKTLQKACVSCGLARVASVLTGCQVRQDWERIELALVVSERAFEAFQLACGGCIWLLRVLHALVMNYRWLKMLFD